MWPFLRIFIGGIFLISGAEKLLAPYQNFLYVVQAYQVLPGPAEILTARLFPWIELGTGVFLVLGLWIPQALRLALVLTAGFIVVVGQALLRGLPIDQCGCFGELVHIAPRTIIVFDSILLLLTMIVLRYSAAAKRFSLDRYFE